MNVCLIDASLHTFSRSVRSSGNGHEQMGTWEEYDDTNRFYRALGFKEFEVFPLLWDEANPCQVYVMHLA